MSPPVGILDLLVSVVRLTAGAYHGKPANADTLREARECALEMVLTQADLGVWKEFGVVDRDNLDRLTCLLEIQPTLAIRKDPGAVGIWWDFTGTGLPHLGKVFTSDVS